MTPAACPASCLRRVRACGSSSAQSSSRRSRSCKLPTPRCEVRAGEPFIRRVCLLPFRVAITSECCAAAHRCPVLRSFPSADLLQANERCASVEIEVRQEVSVEMARQLKELEERYQAMQSSDRDAAEVRQCCSAACGPHLRASIVNCGRVWCCCGVAEAC